jgi:hypothetical protein
MGEENMNEPAKSIQDLIAWQGPQVVGWSPDPPTRCGRSSNCPRRQVGRSGDRPTTVRHMPTQLRDVGMAPVALPILTPDS